MNIQKEVITHLRVNRYREASVVNLPPRPTASVGYFESGEARYTVGQESFTVRAGDCVFVPRGCQYRISHLGPTVYLSAHFNFISSSSFFEGRRIPIQVVPHTDGVHPLLCGMKQDQQDPARVLSFLSKFYALCDAVLPQLAWEPLPKHDPRIEKALEILDRGYREKINIDELARLCCMSVSHFHALFKKETGTTPVEYRNHAAILNAQQLLLDDPSLPIEEAAYACGFENTAYFRRVFHAETGLSPRAYRKSELYR